MDSFISRFALLILSVELNNYKWFFTFLLDFVEILVGLYNLITLIQFKI